MAKRHSVHPTNNGKGAVVFGATVYEVPLLPYEKQLIQTIGVTEEEYREFAAEAKRRGAVRPAAYDRIPDIRNAEPTTALAYLTATQALPAITTAVGKGTAATIATNVAIGLVLSYASYLLAPKPKMPRSKQGGAIDLGSLAGANRFTPSNGFDTVAELADYAAPIPLIFGLYKDDVGGMLTTPKLIWSRMFSHGTMQRAKLMFVVGEQGITTVKNESGVVVPFEAGIDKPELDGIFLGNNPLDAIFEDYFAFYWHGDSSVNHRINGKDKRYGTRGKPHRGDPDVPNDSDVEVFDIPTSNVVNAEQEPPQPGEKFCHAYTPSNNTLFGVHSSIANGTDYRVNYQLIPINEEAKRKPRVSTILERIKIVGDSGVKINGKTLQERGIQPGSASTEDLDKIRKKGSQKGAGRNYSPRMGLIKAKGQTVSGANLRTVVENVEKGDLATFAIRDSKIDEDFYHKGPQKLGPSVDDINSGIETLQLQADSAMQLGEHFEIGGSIWKVINRKAVRFDPGTKNDQIIELQCVDTSTSISKKIGIVSNDRIVEPSDQFIGDSQVGDTSKSVGEGYFPLSQVSIATIRNNRPCVVTEIGIKSTVFQRLNGICNFQTLPDTDRFKEFEDDNVQITTGTMNAAITRSSFFRILVKDVDKSNDFSVITSPEGPLFFAVRGQQPIAQYNSIRFTTSDALTLEYKFIPVSGTEMGMLTGKETIVELSSSASIDQKEQGSGGPSEIPCTTVDHTILVFFHGRVYKGGWKDHFFKNKEFAKGSKEVSPIVELSYPSAATFVNAVPNPPDFGTIAAINVALKKGANHADSYIKKGKLSAFFYEIAGTADDPDVPLGGRRVFTSLEYIGGETSSWLHLQWRLKKIKNKLSWAPGEEFAWAFVKCKVLGSGGGFYKGQEIKVLRGSDGGNNKATNAVSGQTQYNSSTNPFVSGHEDGVLKFSGISLSIQEVKEDVELVARSQAWRYEIGFGAVDRAAGEKKTITRVISEGDKDIKVKLTSRVVDFNVETNGTIVGQYQGWSIAEVTEVIQDSNTSKTWTVGDTFTSTRNVSANNPFKTRYDRVGATYKISAVDYVETVAPVVEIEGISFGNKTQVSDISRYRDLVDKSNSGGPEHEIVYVNEALINNQNAKLNNLTLAGLSLKAGREYTSLDQMRCWLAGGMAVERLHPGSKQAVYGSTEAAGPSNLLTDLVYFLLTDQIAGAGGLLGMNPDNDYLVDKKALEHTSRFLFKQKLFFNGAITDRTNLRQFIAEIAPNFLCNFVIQNGKYSLTPAVPTDDKGEIKSSSTEPVQVSQIFSAGNILEDSYKLDYLNSEERRAFKAIVRFRQERKNKLPEEQVIVVKGVDDSGDFATPGTDRLPEEQFDLTQFCTTREHAFKVARYFLALRAYVTHTISFSTTAEGLNVGAGSYIKVFTEASPYNSANTGTINSSGVVTSVRDLPDNDSTNPLYNIVYFKTGDNDVNEGSIRVSNGKVEDSSYHDIIFTVQDSSVSSNIYIVEQLTFSQEGIVDIVASEHACDDDGVSKIAKAVDGFEADVTGFTIQS